MKQYLLLVLVMICFLATFSGELVEGIPRTVDYLSRFWPPDFSSAGRILNAVFNTLVMSVMGTSLAIVTSIPLSYLACKETTPGTWVYHPVRLLVTVIRGLPFVVMGILLVAIVGLGTTAGILGIWLHSTGTMTKYLSEYLEASSKLMIDAAAIDGATKWQTYKGILLPIQQNMLLGLVLYYFEANFRSATVLGIVGAGGVGLELLAAIGRFKYGRVTFIVLLVVMVSYFLDIGSRKLRERYL